MLTLRRALINSDWDTIIGGVKRYADYCKKAGIEGTVYVQKPQTFIEEGGYLESFVHSERIIPKNTESIAGLERRFQAAVDAGRRLPSPLSPFPGESVAAFETRVRLAESLGPEPDRRIPEAISSLAARLRLAK